MTDPGRALRALALAVLVAGSVLVAPLGPTGTAAAANTVGGCTTIDSPGVYVLGSDVTASGSECFTITSSDVVLDGGDNSVRMTADGDAVNVTSPGSIANVTVRNVAVENADDAVVVHARADDAVVDVTLANNYLNNTSDGVDVTADGNRTDLDLVVRDNRIVNVTNDGIDAVDADGPGKRVAVRVEGNVFDVGGEGVDRVDADGVDTRLAVRVHNNTMRAGDDGFEEINAFSDNQTIRVAVTDNVVRSDGDGISDFEMETADGSVAVDVSGNVFNSTSGDGVGDLHAHGRNTSVDVAVTDNRMNVSGSGVGIIDAYRENQTVTVAVERNAIRSRSGSGLGSMEVLDNSTLRMSVANNDIHAEDHAIDDLYFRGGNGSIDLAIVGNTLNATTSEAIDDIDATGYNRTVDLLVRNNTIASAGSDGIEYVEAEALHQDVAVDVVGNEIYAADAAIQEISADDDYGSAAVRVVGNRINSTTSYGIEYVYASGDDKDRTVVVADNRILSNEEGVDDVETSGYNGTTTVRLLGNDIDSLDSYGVDYLVDSVGPNQVVDVDVVGNDIDAYYDAIYEIDTTDENVTADVDVVGNHFNSSDDSGIEDLWVADDDDQRANLTVYNNTVVAEDDAVDDIDAYGTNTTARVHVVNNTFVSVTGWGFDDIEADSDNQTVDLLVLNNDVRAAEDGFEDVEVDGDNTTAEVAVVDNTIDAGEAGIDDLDLDGDDETATVTVARNTIEAAEDGIEDVDVDGEREDVRLLVYGNNISGFVDYGIEFNDVQLHNGSRFEGLVVANTLDGNDSTALGVRVDPDSGVGPATGNLTVAHNDVSDGTVESAVQVEAGPVGGITLEGNDLAGVAYGVNVTNTSAVLDARGNYWNASDGPSSTGPLADPVTGALANGTGSAVSAANATLSNVRFDAALEAEPSPAFGVALTGTNADVEEGSVLRVNATVENRDAGHERTTRTVELVVGGEVRDTKRLRLWPGESKEVRLAWNTSDGDLGRYDATVRTQADAESDRVVVLAPNHVVSVDATDSPVVEGSTLTVETTVENTGTEAGSRQVTLTVGGTEVDSTLVSLSPNESTTVELTWSTVAGDAGTYTATVASGDDTASTSVAVDEPASFRVSVDSTSGPVDVGEQVSVTATVENVGDRRGSQTVRLTADGTSVASTTVDLRGGGSTTVTLSWTPGTPGSYDLTVDAGDDSASASVQVEATPTPTPTPSPTPTDSPTPTATDSPTPSPTDSPTATDGPTTTDAGETATASPAPTSTGAPGFGVVAALAALGVVLLRRRLG